MDTPASRAARLRAACEAESNRVANGAAHLAGVAAEAHRTLETPAALSCNSATSSQPRSAVERLEGVWATTDSRMNSGGWTVAGVRQELWRHDLARRDGTVPIDYTSPSRSSANRAAHGSWVDTQIARATAAEQPRSHLGASAPPPQHEPAPPPPREPHGAPAADRGTWLERQFAREEACAPLTSSPPEAPLASEGPSHSPWLALHLLQQAAPLRPSPPLARRPPARHQLKRQRRAKLYTAVLQHASQKPLLSISVALVLPVSFVT